MRRYMMRVTAILEVCAENIAEAKRLAESVRIIPRAVIGAHRPGPHDRELVHYRIEQRGKLRSELLAEGNRCGECGRDCGGEHDG